MPGTVLGASNSSMKWSDSGQWMASPNASQSLRSPDLSVPSPSIMKGSDGLAREEAEAAALPWVSRKRLQRQSCLLLVSLASPRGVRPALDLVTDCTAPHPPSGRLPVSPGFWLPLSHPDPSCHSQQALSATTISLLSDSFAISLQPGNTQCP